MSKREQKSNREIRKPKSAKPKVAAAQASPFERPLSMGQKKGGGKR